MSAPLMNILECRYVRTEKKLCNTYINTLLSHFIENEGSVTVHVVRDVSVGNVTNCNNANLQCRTYCNLQYVLHCKL